MLKRMMTASLVAACALTTSSVEADITLSDFSFFELSGTYVDWDWGTFTSGSEDFRVEATNFGGGWLFLDSPIDASAEDVLEIVVTTNEANETTGFHVVLFSGQGEADWTEAGFAFEVLPGTNTYTADLNNPTFFNRGDITTWDKSDIWDQWHIQGTFADSSWLDLTFDNLALVAGSGSEFTLSVRDGGCPGAITLGLDGGEPNGRHGYAYSFRLGSWTVPGGPCTGLELGIVNPTVAAIVRSDGEGSSSLSGNVPAGACDRIHVQGVDVGPCVASNVLSL